ncbi:hypothetical protein DFE_0663 [Desulfovibrio ferrophilus]|uniref:Uncharacterized protein n=1 Tax=Desulfovibrio ferrophilus TaxID=241368 RepID=A0A2Z6AVV6_9BACT|nr:hypothetical protein DFE_0663 [Desulfovibrio ferrophilus]
MEHPAIAYDPARVIWQQLKTLENGPFALAILIHSTAGTQAHHGV